MASRVLKDLNKLGVHVSLDDFGNGYSSLNYLKQFPLKVLKIDQSFVQDIWSTKIVNAITMAIIAMARSLGLEVVAEGVEKEEQLAFLKSKFCDEVQGFLFSEPLPAKELTGLLQKNFLINLKDYKQRHPHPMAGGTNNECDRPDKNRLRYGPKAVFHPPTFPNFHPLYPIVQGQVIADNCHNDHI